MDSDLLILGAGPCGLGIALQAQRAGLRPLLVDRNPEVGGLCRTFPFGEYRVDLSIHRFQFDEPRVKARLLAMFTGQLHQVRHKSIHLSVDGVRHPYPLKVRSLLRVPPGRAANAAAAYLGSRLRAEDPASCSSYRAWFEGAFGAELYRWITGPLMEKQWGLPGEQLCASFGSHRRVSVQWRDLLSDVPLISRLLARAIPQQFLYGRDGVGPLMSLVGRQITDQGGRTLLERRVVKVLCRRGAVTEVLLDDGTLLPAGSALACTLPLPALVGLLDPAPPPALLEAAAALRFRDLVVVALALDRPRVSEDHVTYYPEARFPFTRTFESKNASPYMVPPGRTVLGFELPCFAGDDLWRADDQELLQRMAAFGPDVGFSPEEVLQGLVLRIPEAYPVYHTGHRQQVSALLAWLHGLKNLYMVGRNGLFRLDNMNHAFAMGFDLAQHLARGRGPAAWHALLPRYNKISYID